MIPALQAQKVEALQEKVNRRRRLIADLVALEEELLAAGVISRRVVLARSVVHGTARYTADFEAAAVSALDGRGKLD